MFWKWQTYEIATANYLYYPQSLKLLEDSDGAVLSANVLNGTTPTTISPKSNLTYAEAAQAIKNLLVESKLVNR